MKDHCLWDRSLWEEALLSENADFIDLPLVSGFKEIYIGHTPTIKLGAQDPMRALNVWNLDTGAGHPNGRLTIIDVETKEYWQSEITEKIYLK
ncbi:MAG: hypothetical protein HRT61_16425 [Ekhidna sp.]|nr:hypothetical protein [Ekhidna sp.]